MILTDFYFFEKRGGTKSRIDCTNSTGGYPPFERLRKNGKLPLYILANHIVKAKTQRRADYVLTDGSSLITSLYPIAPELYYWYGDIKDTSDLLLVDCGGFDYVNGGIVEGAEFDVFIARGQRRNQFPICNLWVDGGLNAEIERLVRQAETLRQEKLANDR